MPRLTFVMFWLGFVACAGPHAGSGHGDEGHGGQDEHADGVDRRAMDHHFAEPESFATEWNDPARDAWQKPQEIVAAAELKKGETVADLGAGTGYLIEPLKTAVGPAGRVLALDVEPAMIEFLEKRQNEAGWERVMMVHSDHDDPKLAASSVDAVVTLNTWHHVEERVDFARMLYAALTPGGRFVVVEFLKEPTEGRGPPVEMRLTPGEVLSELQAAGFAATIVDETLPRHYIVVGTRE